MTAQRDMLVHQYEAALATMRACVDQCPDASWDAPVANLAFCQVVFHTLFFADYYLGPSADGLRDQAFHREHPEFFRDYEELEDRPQKLLYDRPTTIAYLDHCLAKARRVVGAEDDDALAAPCGFERRDFSRGELHLYTIRHIQHHAAQLALRLRLDHAVDTPWFGSGWRTIS